MHLQRDSVVGVRFLAEVKAGGGLKPSARSAGVGKGTGYRWLREEFVLLREQGLTVAACQVELGFAFPVTLVWDEQWRSARHLSGRHHLAVDVDVEQEFWRRFEGGAGVEEARRAAGVGRSTAYRWWRARFGALREQGHSVRVAAKRVRVPLGRAMVWEQQQRVAREHSRRGQDVLQRQAVRDAARNTEEAVQRRAPRPARLERDTRYWELMRSGMTNTAACKILGVHRKTGSHIRTRYHQQSPPPTRTCPGAGRYLSLGERLQIADLLRLGLSLRAIGAELGRSPSTIKREVDRHRDSQGRYLPHVADHAAVVQRRRPREHRLVADPKLRALVQRKLNRCWSPDEISGWLRRAYPDDTAMRLCPETIYRALLVPGGRGLHKRYCAKLRTGRRIRKSRWLTRSGHGPVVQGMTMINERPAQVETRERAGDWEGDLIVGAASASAMVTLRERKTQYGIVVNLPADHTAATVNAAVIQAFAPLPAHMKRTLTWDQGVEMASHLELSRQTGVPIYFAERSSPWQRGANENYNGLLRQYFPKSTDLSIHSEKRVTAVMNEVNTRPRKQLDYDTPAARFRAESRRSS